MSEHAEVLEAFMGKRLVGFAQEPSRAGQHNSGHWRNAEPLYLTFEDGSILSVAVSGWHDSGDLFIEDVSTDKGK